jgi:uncharacterized protein (DUF1800 family)
MRRSLGLILGLASVAVAMAGGVENFHSKLKGDRQIEHLLSRLTFGARPGDMDRVKGMGWKKWVEWQLAPEKIPENPALVDKLAAMPTLEMSTQELAKRYPSPQVIGAVAQGRLAMPDEPELRRMYERMVEQYKDRKAGEEGARRPVAPLRTVVTELTEAKIYRAVLSERQLEEVLTDFWFNHFNVFLEKGADRWLTTSYEREAIRPFVLGSFEDMLKATAQHPAMLFYLDNWQSVSESFGKRLPKARGLNENYARELMELHTLGVDGGYTQKDVQEVARCFTGWTIDQPLRGAKFRFAPRAHDNGEKLVLGQKIPAGGGMQDGIKVISILAKHPNTARFVSRKLAQRFVADEPPAALVEKMARTFSKTNGDLKEVMKTLIFSPEFSSEGAYRAKMKSPLEMVAGALRASEARLTNAMQVAQALEKMGQPLYRKQEPTGYSNNGEEWVNSAALLARMNFAVALSENKVRGVEIDRERYAALAKNMGAPEFQRR